MTSPIKPTIVMVPGAWHSPSHYATLLSHLESSGYPTTSSRLLSVDSPTPLTATAAEDASFIREKTLLPLLDQGKDILLVIHSYGGIPGGAAARGLSKSERAKEGNKGGIIGLVFIAAFLATEGNSLEKMVGGKLNSWVEINESQGTSTVPSPTPIFYADVQPASLAATAAATLRPHALLAFRSPSPASPAWSEPFYDHDHDNADADADVSGGGGSGSGSGSRNGGSSSGGSRRAYILCAQDAAVPAWAQEAMLEHSGGGGVRWDVRVLQSAHSPQLSRPGEVAALVEGWAERWGDIPARGGVERPGE